MRAPLLALLGLLVVAMPALAARSSDRQPGTAARAKVSAPASHAARTSGPARGQAVAPTRSGRTTPAAAPSRRGRTVQAAPARGGRATQAAASSRSSRSAAARATTRGGRSAQAATTSRRGSQAQMTTRRGAHYAVLQGGPVCRNGQRNCRIYRVSAPQPMRWSQGLSPALNVQTSNCPAGTMATLATGHANIVRCMPI